MNKQSITIGTRVYKTNLPLTQELSFLADKNYLFALTEFSVVKVSGDHAAEFLQGQLSCDIRLVNATTMQQGAQCNLKGRVLALLDVIYCWDSYWLLLPSDLVPATLTSLEKGAMLSRVTLKAMDNIKVWALLVQSNQDLLPDLGLPNHIKKVTATQTSCCYQIGKHDYVLLNQDNDKELNFQAFNTHQQLKSELAWHFSQLNQHRFSIYPETRGLFLPHRLNMQNTGYLSFNKGCYKGQEIIARTHYRATLKHEFIVTTVECGMPPKLGATMLDPKTNLEIGELVDYCPIDDNNHYLIAGSVLIGSGHAMSLHTRHFF
ncbi:MAG: hypothetical protein A3F46_05590 [Legionellales bacterium RIFCSPHIGHO2_12_FULL_42_9]|nr:MAG: hypothetical protein A3F46_05590 [Legionellales bacterium RIFCSPHIGHO2_12_FULL_42_9]